jgi:hypothetical protein
MGTQTDSSCGSMAFSHWEKVPDRADEGIASKGVARPRDTLTAYPLIRRSAPPSPKGRRESALCFA